MDEAELEHPVKEDVEVFRLRDDRRGVHRSRGRGDGVNVSVEAANSEREAADAVTEGVDEGVEEEVSVSGCASLGERATNVDVDVVAVTGAGADTSEDVANVC